MILTNDLNKNIVNEFVSEVKPFPFGQMCCMLVFFFFFPEVKVSFSSSHAEISTKKVTKKSKFKKDSNVHACLCL